MSLGEASNQRYSGPGFRTMWVKNNFDLKPAKAPA